MKTTAEYISILRDYVAKNAGKYHIYLETSKPSLFALVHIKEDLQKLFGCDVDIVRLREHMDAFLRSRIEKEGIYVG